MAIHGDQDRHPAYCTLVPASRGNLEGDTTLDQVREWPEEAVEIFQNVGWIKPKEPAQTVVCPGCEENCFMPVNVRKFAKGLVKAFITCDKLDYMGPVLIPLDYLKQWQITEK